MSKFFHGWRRKVGCVTLVMACVFLDCRFAGEADTEGLPRPQRPTRPFFFVKMRLQRNLIVQPSPVSIGGGVNPSFRDNQTRSNSAFASRMLTSASATGKTSPLTIVPQRPK